MIGGYSEMVRLMGSMWGLRLDGEESLSVPDPVAVAEYVGVDALQLRSAAPDEVQMVSRSRERGGPTTLITFGAMPTAYFDRLPLALTQCRYLRGADVFGRVVYYVRGDRTYLVRAVSENHADRESAVKLGAELMKLWLNL
jgi:hypothetical protein